MGDPIVHWMTNGYCSHTRSHLYPAALNSIIKQETNQVRDTHVPHGGASGNEKNEEVLFLQFYVADDQRKLNPGKEEDDS